MISWPYIAGFFDGEGHVGMTHSVRLKSSHMEVSMYQSAERGRKLFLRVQSWLREQGIESKIYSRPAKGNCKERHTLDIASRDSYTKFLEKVFPYLHIKKIEVQDVLRYLKLFPKTNYWRYQKDGQKGKPGHQ